MSTLDIILATLSAIVLVEGLFLAVFPKQVMKGIKRTFKNRKNVVRVGLIEIIIALLILFLISL